MAININGTFNINNSGGISIKGSSYPVNLTVYANFNPDNPGSTAVFSVSIGGAVPYIIFNGATFPVYDSSPTLYGHHFGGTSINAVGINAMNIYKNGGLVAGGCASPSSNVTWNGTFTANDQVVIYSDYCGG